MLRNLRILNSKFYKIYSFNSRKQSFLTNDYKCNDAWKTYLSYPALNNINLNDFYHLMDQHFSSKGSVSAIDVDIFANAITDSTHLDELKDLLLKLRLSAETGNMLDSTHHATIRNYMEFGNIHELVNILKDPLNYGLFLDDFTSNILLDSLITSNLEDAALVASLVMLQEDYTNEITSSLCQYACYKYIMNYTKPPVPELKKEEKKKKVEEVKIRVKFLRNPYHDDHFDIDDIYTLSGKTLAWISQNASDDVSINLQLLGWFSYRKYDRLLELCEEYANKSSFKLYSEVLQYVKKEGSNADEQTKPNIDASISALSKCTLANGSLEEAIKTKIENSINSCQNKDIQKQQQLFQSWVELRQKKIEEQTYRLDRAKRIELINQKQLDLEKEEQKLWFFENEESIDLQIEEKEKSDTTSTKTKSTKIDENYIPPEIVPKRR